MRAADPKAPFEVHLTVSLDDAQLDTLAAFAEERGYHFIHILLDSGAHPSQPMLSWRESAGLDAALARAESVSTQLRDMGMCTSRVKIEADLSAATRLQPTYLEAHYKVRMAIGQLQALREAAGDLGAHVSENAHSSSEEVEERFLTVRHDDVQTAKSLFDRIEGDIKARGWSIVSTHQEAVLFDSNLDLDEGWTQ